MRKVLMLGPARNVKGGMTTVIDNYYNAGLNKIVELKYIETCNDSRNRALKFLKEIEGKINFYKEIDKYDVVHIHMASRRSTFRKAKYAHIAKKKGKKVILHIHGGEYKIFYNECNEKQKEYIKETFNLADKIIVLSESWKQYFKSLVNEEKIVVISNAIKIPNDFEKDFNRNELLFLGRIYEQKGIYDLLEAFSKLKNEFSDIRLSICGDGELDKINKFIVENNLTSNIKCYGWVSGKEKEKLLTKSSIFLLPSYNEGMPMSILEAMAYKNIVITTNVGGIMIAPGNKEQLYIKIKDIIKDKNKKEKISENARRLIENKFDINKVIKKLIDIYR